MISHPLLFYCPFSNSRVPFGFDIHHCLLIFFFFFLSDGNLSWELIINSCCAYWAPKYYLRQGPWEDVIADIVLDQLIQMWKTNWFSDTSFTVHIWKRSRKIQAILLHSELIGCCILHNEYCYSESTGAGCVTAIDLVGLGISIISASLIIILEFIYVFLLLSVT